MQAGLTSHLRHATMSKKREEDEERQHGGGGGRERGERAAESGRTEWVAVALGALFAREEEGRVVSLAPLQNFRRSCWEQAQTRSAGSSSEPFGAKIPRNLDTRSTYVLW